MEQLPTKASAKGRVLTVADFYEAGREELSLTLVSGGANMQRTVEEPIVNRPGLALTGFYEHFAWRRLQLIGKAEMAYLSSLDAETRRSRFQALIDRRAFCFIFTGGLRPNDDEVALGERSGAVIMTSPLKTRVFSHLSAFVLERLSAPTSSIYGTMVEVCGLGVLIEGAPGLGKSETALGLIKRGHSLIADDLTCVRKEVGNSLLFGSASESTAGYMEIRGIGILHIPSIFGVSAVRGEKQLELVITFRRLQDVKGEIDRIGQTRRVRTILGVDVPNVMIPVSEGRDLVNLVETAAMQQKLLMSGVDPVDGLSERLRKRADAMQSRNVKRKGRR
ncbi:MAG: HPr(Ser) kinase/phosphatase [Kiritimatiellae bacterium]|nr:HPr(Ser) kinase/phosphatase [Kiritimatiellia bacterium]